MFFYLARLLSVWHVECNIKIVWGLTSFFLAFYQLISVVEARPRLSWRMEDRNLCVTKGNFYWKEHSMERGSICGQLDDKQEVGLTWSLWHDSPRLDTSCNLHLMLCFDCFDHFQAVRFVVKLRYFISQISTSTSEWRHWIFQHNVDRKSHFSASKLISMNKIQNLAFSLILFIHFRRDLCSICFVFLEGKEV